MQITCLRGGREGGGRGGIHNLSDCLLPHKRKAHDYLCGWVTQDVMNCVREGGREEGVWKCIISSPFCLCFLVGARRSGSGGVVVVWYLLGISPDVQRGCCCCCCLLQLGD